MERGKMGNESTRGERDELLRAEVAHDRRERRLRRKVKKINKQMLEEEEEAQAESMTFT